MWLQTEVQKNAESSSRAKRGQPDVTQVDGGQLQVTVGSYRLNALPIPGVVNRRRDAHTVIRYSMCLRY
jgi:hypothetical protein